jgi:thiamine-phosphate pyrophosphorylase
VDFAEACLDGGARLLQVRAKRASGRDLLEWVTAVGDLARAVDARVIVNDRADVARAARAAGVHVGQGDLAPSEVRVLVGDAALVGLSTHTMSQLTAALEEPINYAAIGPVFATTTKATGYDPVGLTSVRAAAREAARKPLPLVAIGGITLANARAVIDAGADVVTVISDLLAAGDPGRRVRELVAALA